MLRSVGCMVTPHSEIDSSQPMRVLLRIANRVSVFSTSLTLVLLLCGSLMAQSNKRPRPSAPVAKSKNQEDNTPIAVKPAEPPSPEERAQLEAKLAASILNAPGVEKGDYIPCEFTLSQLLSLSLTPVAPTITPGEEETLKERIITAAAADTNRGAFNDGSRATFIRSIAASSFRGRTPSEALGLVIEALQNSNSAVSTLKAHAGNKTDLDKTVVAQVRANGGSDAVVSKVQSTLASQQTLPNATANLFNYATTLSKLIQENQTDSTADKAVAPVVAATEAAASQNNSAAQESIVDATRNTLQGFTRPTDVGCAMSILSHNETKKAYGQLVANQYIAIQVVVRNLNDQQEFTLHDIELEVNTDASGRRARFFSGRDKVVVRALSASQSSFDLRNLLVHTAQGIGTIMSAVVPIAGDNLAAASGAYNSAFLTSLDKSWKDFTTDQLNLLNDTGFSSSINSRTIVPKSGTALVVIFIPSKQFEQSWWTLPCVDRIYVGSRDKSGKTIPLGQDEDKAGLSLDRALEACQASFEHLQEKGHVRKQTSHKSQREIPKDSSVANAEDTEKSNGESAVAEAELRPSKFTLLHRNRRTGNLVVQVNPADTGAAPAQDLFRIAKTVKYKDWSPTALSIFRELALAVVAGAHIIDDSQLRATVKQLDCPKDKTVGNIDFSKASADTLSCTLTGQNLEKIEKIRLRNAKDTTDSNTAEGTVTVNGDSTNAKVVFSLNQLGQLSQPDYEVLGVTKDGIEVKTSQVLHFNNLTPFLLDIDPKSISLDSAKWPVPVVLTGFHLDNLSNVSLSSDTPALNHQYDVVNAPQRASFQMLKTDDLAKADPTSQASKEIDLKVLLGTSGNASSIDSGKVLKLTGKLP